MQFWANVVVDDDDDNDVDDNDDDYDGNLNKAFNPQSLIILDEM